MRLSCVSLFVAILLLLLNSPSTLGFDLISLVSPWPPFMTPYSRNFLDLEPLSTSKIKGRLLTPEEGCGFSKVTNTKIVGGQDAKQGAWPWIALLGYRTSFFSFAFKCGGSLITSRHVLTPAHCILPDLSFVRLGEHDIDAIFGGSYRNVDVVRTEKHDYNTFDMKNDIAILYLKRDVYFTERIRPICLPVTEPIRNESFVDSNPFVAGWGRLSENGTMSPVLQQLQLPVLENIVCTEAFGRQRLLNSPNQFSSEVLCVGHKLSGRDSCRGDSGGPLMLPHNENGKFPFYQIGIISYGAGCGRENLPGAYTNVAFYADWILEKLKS